MKTIQFPATLAVAAIAMCFSVLAHAQNKLSDASISGHIIDSKTGEHLPYVMVMVGGTQIGIQTSSSGHYAIRNLPLGKHDIIASFVGYKDSAVSMDIEAGKTYEVNFSLEPESLSLDGVVVSATRNRTSRKMAPALVNVIESRIFASTSSPTLAEAALACRDNALSPGKSMDARTMPGLSLCRQLRICQMLPEPFPEN